jgi:hypothetical protein
MIALKTDSTGRVTRRHYRPDDIDTTGWLLVEAIPDRPDTGPLERAVLYADENSVSWQVEDVPSISIPAESIPDRPEDAVELTIDTDSLTGTWV